MRSLGALQPPRTTAHSPGALQPPRIVVRSSMLCVNIKKEIGRTTSQNAGAFIETVTASQIDSAFPESVTTSQNDGAFPGGL